MVDLLATTLATTTRPWAGLPLERAFAGAAAGGFGSVVLPVHGVPDPITGASDPEEVAAVRRDSDRAGLDVLALTHEFLNRAPDDRALQELLRLVDHCERLGAPFLADVGHPDPRWRAAYVATMRVAAEYAADRGVRIAVKPHGGITRTVQDLAGVVADVDHPAFGVYLEPGLLLHFAGDGALRDLGRLANLTFVVGVRDHPGRGLTPDSMRERPPRNVGMPPSLSLGTGVIDFDAVLADLRALGVQVPVVAECTSPVATPEAADRQVRAARSELQELLSGRPDPTSRVVSSAGEGYVRPAPRLGPESVRCSTRSREVAEPALGTARHFDDYLILEIPTPWPRTMGRPLWEYASADPRWADGLRAADEVGLGAGRLVKPLAVMPDDVYSVPGHTRVTRMRLTDGPSGGYAREEYLVPTRSAGDVAAALMTGDLVAIERSGARRESTPYRDLLVCTHGAVDRCCGSLGYPIYDTLRAGGGEARQTRIWRTSSFGGHRFAPTLIDLPTGRYWGGLDADTALTLLDRSPIDGDLADRYRGWGAVSHPIAQTAEAALLRLLGWDLYGASIELRSLDDGSDDRHAELAAIVRGVEATRAWSIEVSRQGEHDVLVGCNGIFARRPRYCVTAMTEIDGSASLGRPLDLDSSTHAKFAGDRPH